MKTNAELVSIVYNNSSFRGEFKSFIKLRATIRRANENKGDNYSPDELTYQSEVIQKYRRGMTFIYSALFRALSSAYKLNDEETRLLILDVSDRYSQSASS